MSAAELITSPVDTIVLAGQRSPGVATISGDALKRRLHQRRAFGVAGATAIDQGGELVPFNVHLEFTTSEQLEAWDAWKELLVRPASRQTVGQDIEHPVLADAGITQCLLEGRTLLEKDDYGKVSTTIKFLEFRAPVVALAVPDSTATVTPANGSPEQIIASQDAQIQALLADQAAP